MPEYRGVMMPDITGFDRFTPYQRGELVNTLFSYLGLGKLKETVEQNAAEHPLYNQNPDILDAMRHGRSYKSANFLVTIEYKRRDGYDKMAVEGRVEILYDLMLQNPIMRGAVLCHADYFTSLNESLERKIQDATKPDEPDEMPMAA